MTTPKPAPGKPLTFTPPQFLKGETQSSELPYIEEAKVTGNIQGARPNIVIVDEIYHENGTVELELGSSKENKKPAVEKPKKPFVLDQHLTQRPFHDDRLMQLKSRLQRPSFKNR
jgi:hypothetical protein